MHRYYLIRCTEGEETDIQVSQEDGEWASSGKNNKIFEQWYKYGHEIHFIFCSWVTPWRTSKFPLYGHAVMRSPPIPGSRNRARWVRPKGWADNFKVEWLEIADHTKCFLPLEYNTIYDGEELTPGQAGYLINLMTDDSNPELV